MDQGVDRVPASGSPLRRQVGYLFPSAPPGGLGGSLPARSKFKEDFNRGERGEAQRV